MLDQLGPDAGLRDWIACLVRPSTEHLATLGAPTWYARFSAQMMTDPALRDIMIDEALASPALQQILEGLNRCLPTLPVEVRRERGDIGRHLLVHMIAERERALAEDAPTPRATWADAATGLIDALVGMWTAPVTPPDTTTDATAPRPTEAGRP
jgi:Tetracyclin repressor-like, C-terminal domain